MAGRTLPFDREHCDGCNEIVSRGSLVNTRVGTGSDPDAWKALCRRCIRQRSEAVEAEAPR